MLYSTTEEIAHFIGYLQLHEQLNLLPRHYLGAPKYNIPDLHIPQAAIPQALAELGAKNNIDPAAIKFPLFPAINYNHHTPTPRLEIPELGTLRPLPLNPRFEAPPTPVPPAPIYDFDLRITANYKYGGSQYLIAHIQQMNLMEDSDTVVSVLDELDQLLELAKNGLDGAAADAVAAQLGLLSSLMPSLVGDLIADAVAKGVDTSSVSLNDLEARPFFDLSEASGKNSDLLIVPDQNGTYENGELVSSSGQSAVTQFEDLESVLQRHEPDSEDSILASIVEAVSDEPIVFEDFAEGWLPNGIGEIDVTTGSNTVTNAAVINDIHGADASRIIVGDFNETNAIVQLNLYTELDGPIGNAVSYGAQYALSLLNGVSFSEATAPSTSASLTNQASFEHLTGIAGNGLFPGGPGVLEWNVQFVYGDYYDVTVVEQRNLMTDSDVIQTQTINTKLTAELGDNDQLNIVQHTDMGFSFDLIIVMGDWTETNVIVQLNMLVDDELWADGSNSLLNDAAIVSVGGASPMALNETAEELVEAIGNQETEFDYELAAGLLDNGDGEFNVLYITGDYLATNVVMQTNVVVDADVAGHLPTPGDATFEGASQDNSLANIALINDVDSVAEYQMLGGEAYEESVLLQANIIDYDNVETSDYEEGNIHPDVIATIAAMSGADDYDQHEQHSSGYVAAGDVDVLGGIAA